VAGHGRQPSVVSEPDTLRSAAASQGGDATMAHAPDVAQSFSIARGNQTISFAALPDKTFGDPDFPVNATASSGLPVSFSAAGTCTVVGNTVHLTSAGSCTITASQGGNANYFPASDVAQSFTINAAPPGTPLTIASSVEGQLTFAPNSWVNGGFKVKLSQSNSSPVTVTVTGNVPVVERVAVKNAAKLIVDGSRPVSSATIISRADATSRPSTCRDTCWTRAGIGFALIA